MKSDIKEIKQVLPADTLPNGEYPGTWGGYRVQVTIDGAEYHIQTRLGIRTIAAPCVVRVQDGEVTIEAQETAP